MNSICKKKKKKKKQKFLQLAKFAIFFKFRGVLISSKAKPLMFSNTEEPYNKLQKYLNSATSKLFYCFSSLELKIEEMQKLQKFHIFCFLNLHNLLGRACNQMKLYIF